MNTTTLLLMVFALSLLATTSSGSSLDSLKFVKISGNDARAVIKEGDGKLRVIKPGDEIGNGLRVKEIVAGRIVLEERTDKGPETVIVRKVNDQTKIERLRKQSDKGPMPVNR